MSRFKYTLLLFLILLVNACYKDKFNDPTTEEPTDSEVFLKKKIFGQVFNDQNEVVPFAKIIFREKSYTSDELGNFNFEDYVSVNRSVIRVFKPGLTEAILPLQSFEQGNQNINIKLSTENIGFFDASSAFRFYANQNLFIDFQAFSFQNSDSSTYQGQIKISFNLIENNNAFGSLASDYLVKSDDSYTSLQSQYSPIVIKITDLNNKLLFFKKPGNLTILNLTSLVNANDTKLWKLDFQKAYWNMVGIIQKNSSNTVCKIPTNGTYVLATNDKAIKIKGRFTQIHQLPTLNVVFSSKDNVRNVPINDEGFYETYLPVNRNFEMLLENQYRQILYAKNISTGLQDIDQGNIELLNNKDILPIKLQIFDCNLENAVNNWLVVREIGVLKDYVFRPKYENMVNEIIKINATGKFILFGAGNNISNGGIQQSDPINISLLDPLQINKIQLCKKDKAGQSEMILQDEKGQILGSHFFPYNEYNFVGRDNSNGLIDITWTDYYSENDLVRYNLNLKLVNGSATIINNNITPEIKGIPANYFSFYNVTSASVKILERPAFPNSVYIEIKGLKLKDQLGKLLVSNVNGFYFK